MRLQTDQLGIMQLCCRQTQGTYTVAGMRLKTDPLGIMQLCCRQTKGTYSSGHEAADRPIKNEAADRPKELTVAGMRLQTDPLRIMLQKEPKNLQWRA